MDCMKDLSCHIKFDITVKIRKVTDEILHIHITFEVSVMNVKEKR